MKTVSFHWSVGGDYQDELLRDFLRKEKKLSRQVITDIKQYGQLLVNKENVTVRKVLKEGDEVTVVFPPEKRSEGLQPKEISLQIVYEDEHLLIINKQANLPTIPSIYHPDWSLANGVLYYYDQKQIPCTFHAVNRLDRDTSGLLIVAKHRYAHDLLAKQQKQGKINRTYLAIVHGHLKSEQGSIDAPIGRKEDSIIERVVREDGQEAKTNYKVVKRLEAKTVVQLSLETGRTHQIRVHMAYIGHPLLGDDLYGGKKTKINRQALHSCQLQFFHPFLDREMTFIAEIPIDMENLLKEKYEDT